MWLPLHIEEAETEVTVSDLKLFGGELKHTGISTGLYLT